MGCMAAQADPGSEALRDHGRPRPDSFSRDYDGSQGSIEERTIHSAIKHHVVCPVKLLRDICLMQVQEANLEACMRYEI